MRLVREIFEAVLVIEPLLHEDDRGVFSETLNDKLLSLIPLKQQDFCLEYFSTSAQWVVRGLHYQLEVPQGKLVSCLHGGAFDVVVDMRQTSPTFGRHAVVHLDPNNRTMVWVPPGFAHGFQAIAPDTLVTYKCSGQYSRESERCVLWNDPELNIDWPNKGQALLSEKDAAGVFINQADCF